MTERTKTGLEILQVALLMGIAGDALLRTSRFGLNFFVWVAALASAMLVLFFRRKREGWSFNNFALTGAMIFFAAMFAVRDAVELRAFDFLAMLGILALIVLPSLKIKAQIAGVIHYGVAGAFTGISTLLMPLFLIFDDIDWGKMSGGGWTKQVVSVLRGFAIAVPIIFIFGALFMAADAAFEGLVQRTFNFDLSNIMPHILVTSFLTWAVAGYLRGSVMGLEMGPWTDEKPKSESLSVTPQTEKPATEAGVQEPPPAPMSVTAEVSDDDNKKEAPKTEPQPEPKKKWNWQNFDNSILPQFFTLGKVEIGIVLGLINLLFLTFVVIQIPYLFGGMNLVQTTPDFKLAEYARRGFFELVWVALLVLPILLTSHWLLRRDNPVNEKLFRVLAGIQIGLLFVIMISATQRMLLYTGNLGYGLTLERLYPMAFMSWLALVFVWFAATVLRGAREQFAWGAVWLALFVLGTLHVMNPDDFVVRTNLRLMQEGRSFDAHYNTRLSDDSIPALLESMPLLSDADRCSVKGKMIRRLADSPNEDDVRMWNWSRWHAKALMSESADIFDVNGCSPNLIYRPSRYDYDD